MTNYELIKQLKTLKNVSPNEVWVNLTYDRLVSNFGETKSQPFSLSNFIREALRLNAKIQGRAAYYALAVFVAAIGLFSMFYSGLVSGDMDRIAANLYFTRVSQIKLVVENTENVVDGLTAFEVEKIAQDAGASYIKKPASSDSLSNNNNSASETPEQNSQQTYTVIFKEGSDSKEKFTRLLRERIEIKLYELTQAIKGEDENIKQQIGSILNEAGEAFGKGELIEALELVSAAEKSLKSSAN